MEDGQPGTPMTKKQIWKFRKEIVNLALLTLSWMRKARKVRMKKAAVTLKLNKVNQVQSKMKT